MRKGDAIRKTATATVLAALLALAPATGRADEPPRPGEHPTARVEQMLREATENLMRALDTLLLAIPLYEMPEVTDDGDIIIRRKRPGGEADPPADEGETERI